MKIFFEHVMRAELHDLSPVRLLERVRHFAESPEDFWSELQGSEILEEAEDTEAGVWRFKRVLHYGRGLHFVERGEFCAKNRELRTFVEMEGASSAFALRIEEHSSKSLAVRFTYWETPRAESLDLNQPFVDELRRQAYAMRDEAIMKKLVEA